MVNVNSLSKLQVLWCKSPSCTDLNNSLALLCTACVSFIHSPIAEVLQCQGWHCDGQRWSLCAVAGLVVDMWLRSPYWNSCVIMKLFSSCINNGDHHFSSLELMQQRQGNECKFNGTRFSFLSLIIRLCPCWMFDLFIKQKVLVLCRYLYFCELFVPSVRHIFPLNCSDIVALLWCLTITISNNEHFFLGMKHVDEVLFNHCSKT